MKLKGIVFDLDGTLVDSLGVTFDGFNHGIRVRGGRPMAPREIMNYVGTGEREIFAAILGNAEADEAYAAYRDYVEENLGHVPMHNGILELLNALDRAGIPASIFTGRSWNTTQSILRHHGWLGRFVTVVANDHVKAPKPAPEGLHLALERMKLKPSEVLLVGDMPADICAANAAGARGVAALWDATVKREELEPHSPHYWAENPKQLWGLCESLL